MKNKKRIAPLKSKGYSTYIIKILAFMKIFVNEHKEEMYTLTIVLAWIMGIVTGCLWHAILVMRG